MESTKQFSKQIILNPSELTENYKETIINKINKKKCDENGVIISLGDIKSIKNVISRDGKFINFTVDIDILIAKPEIGIILSLKPSLIINKGIFFKMYEHFHFFVPNDSKLKEWTFINNSFKKNNKTINKDDEVTIIITNIRYDNNKFNCICDLV